MVKLLVNDMEIQAYCPDMPRRKHTPNQARGIDMGQARIKNTLPDRPSEI